MIFNLLLVLHIAGGYVGLMSGILNIIRPKGDKTHKIIGKLFFFSMLLTGFSSFMLAWIHPNYFLCMIGIFTLYMVVSGQRYIQRTQKYTGTTSIKNTDWIITYFMLLAGALFIVIGIWTVLRSNLFGLVSVTFGSIGLMFVRQDFHHYRKKDTIKNFWLIGHIQRMTGGFIAALSAFLVVNAKYLPDLIPGYVYWLLPTVVFTPLIVKWSRQYSKN